MLKRTLRDMYSHCGIFCFKFLFYFLLAFLWHVGLSLSKNVLPSPLNPVFILLWSTNLLPLSISCTTTFVSGVMEGWLLLWVFCTQQLMKFWQYTHLLQCHVTLIFKEKVETLSLSSWKWLFRGRPNIFVRKWTTKRQIIGGGGVYC